MATALISGSSSGIGYEFARIFARNGYDLVLVSRNKTDTADEVFSDISIIDMQLDLSRLDSVAKLCTYLKAKSITVDVLVNNAGFGDYAEFKDADFSKLNQMIQLNITALTELTHSLLPVMIKQKSGKIINLASVASFLPGPYMAVYYATKHYVLTFSESLAEELSNSGVTVTALCPGPTQSKFQSAASMESSKLVKGRKLPTSQEVAEYGYKVAMSGQRVAIHGWRNRALSIVARLMPRNTMARMVNKVSGK